MIRMTEHINQINEKYSSEYKVSMLDWILGRRIELLTSVFLLLSGIGILLNKKIGWILSFTAWLMIISFLYPLALYGIQDVTTTVMGEDFWIRIFSGLGLLFALSILIIQATRQLRERYQIDTKAYMLSMVLVVLLYASFKFI